MGKASSSKKVSRVAKTGGGRTKRGGQARSLLFPAVIAVTVILGVFLVVVSRESREVDASPPQPGDHWHVAIGFYVCDTFVPDLPDNGNDPLGIHGHGDGLVHIHPFTSLAGGSRATLGVYFDALEIDVGEDGFDVGLVDPVQAGTDDCSGEPAEVATMVWDSVDDEAGTLVPGDPGDIRPENGQLITVAFVSEGAEIPKPPSQDALAAPVDVTPTTVAGATTTTVAETPAEATTTTGPEATTTTTAAP